MYKMDNIKIEESSRYDFYDLLNKWKEVKSANTDYLYRVNRNYKYYSALQTPDVIKNIWLNELNELGIEAKNYNLVQMYVDGHAGNLGNYITSPRFVTHEKENDELISNFQEIYYEDFNLLGYEQSLNQAIQNSCVIMGIEEIKIVRSKKYPLGRIKFEPIFPSLILFDPSVRGNNIAKESKIAFKEFYMSAKEASVYFPHKTEEIKYLINKQTNYEEQTVDEKTQLREQLLWNNKIQLLEAYVIEPTFTTIEYDSENKVFLPDTKEKIGSSIDIAKKQQWAAERNISISPMITATKIYEDCLYVKTFIPQMGIMLENRKDERQLKDGEGKVHLPFYTHSFMVSAGISSGVPDQAIYAQDDINLRELTKSKMFYKTPQGKWIIHDSLHNGDPARKSKIEQELTDPTTPIYTPVEIPPSEQLIKFVSPTPMNPEYFRDEAMKINLFDKILKMPPAAQGAYGKSGESALLHDRKITESNIMLKSMIDRFNDYQMSKYNDWKQLAVQIYGGNTINSKNANLNREFRNKDKKVIINELLGINEDGTLKKKNDFSTLDPDKIIVVQEKKNSYMRQLRRETDFTLVQQLPQDPNSIGIRAILWGDLLSNVESLSEEQKQIVEQITALSVDLNKKQLILQNYQLEQQLNQSVDQQSIIADLKAKAEQEQSMMEQGQMQGQINLEQNAQGQ